MPDEYSLRGASGHRDYDLAAAEEARVNGKRAGPKKNQGQRHCGQIKSGESTRVLVSGGREKQHNAVEEVAESCDHTRERRQESGKYHKTQTNSKQSKRPGGRFRSVISSEGENALSDCVYGNYNPKNNKADAEPPIWKGGKEFLQPVPPRAKQSTPLMRLARMKRS